MDSCLRKAFLRDGRGRTTETEQEFLFRTAFCERVEIGMGRRECREEIFKLLFRVEFNRVEDMPEQMSLFFNDINEEEEPKTVDAESRHYIEGKYRKIMEKLSEIDRMIDEKAEKWDTKRMSKVDLTIIRLAVYEMLYDDDIPVGVAINEAVELAKKFGQDESSGFVNGVLARFTK